jgi:hypothetical protein
MSPVLSNLVTQANSIQQLGTDQSQRALAFLLSALSNSIYGQTPVVASLTSLNPVVANSIAAAFQGMTQEQFLDIYIYTIVATIQRLNSLPGPGPVTGSQLSTNGFTLNALISANWGGAPGITDAQQVEALTRYGTLLQAGANLNGITNPF